MNVRNLIPWGKNPGNLLPWRKNRGELRRMDDDARPFFALHREMNRVFDDFLRDFDAPRRAGPAWPSIEVSETGDEVKVVAEVPGLDKRDVELSLHDGVLTLRGEKKLERNGSLYSERWEGAFERIIPVGVDVDPGKVDASFRNGVLTVRLPKKPEARREVKRIAIN
jgi:HSP20 family protein